MLNKKELLMTEVPIEIFKMQKGYHILCRIKIKNKEYRVVIDTGSTETIFDIKKIGNIFKEKIEKTDDITYDFNGNLIENDVVGIEEFFIGDIKITNRKIKLSDFNNFNNNFRKNGLPLIDGIIGNDILYEYQAVIDYNKRILYLL